MYKIRFRGKTIENGFWVYGSYIRFQTGECYIISDVVEMKLASKYTFRVDPETIGQYTYLNDSEGEEIHDGDIISYVLKKEVIFTGGDFGKKKYTRTKHKETVKYENHHWSFSSNIHIMEKIKIIGNIYDNKESKE